MAQVGQEAAVETYSRKKEGHCSSRQGREDYDSRASQDHATAALEVPRTTFLQQQQPLAAHFWEEVSGEH